MLTPEQVELRQSGIGSSDVAALFGMSYQRQPIDVYLEKIGEAEPFAANERTSRGSDLESMVLGWYHEDVGGLSWQRPSTLRRTDRTWHLLTPDAIRGTRVRGPRPLLEDPLTGALVAWPREACEIKTHGWRAGRDYGDEGTDDVPDRVRLQVAWQMSGLELGQISVVALIDTHLLRAFPCARDLELEGYLLEEAERFWIEHVLERRPPDPDGTESFKRYIEGRFADTGEVVEATPELLDLADAFVSTKDDLDVAKVRHELAKQELQLAIGPAALVELDGHKVASWKRDSRGRPKHAAIIEELARELQLPKGELDTLIDRHRGEATRRLIVKGRP